MRIQSVSALTHQRALHTESQTSCMLHSTYQLLTIMLMFAAPSESRPTARAASAQRFDAMESATVCQLLKIRIVSVAVRCRVDFENNAATEFEMAATAAFEHSLSSDLRASRSSWRTAWSSASLLCKLDSSLRVSVSFWRYRETVFRCKHRKVFKLHIVTG